MKKKFNVEGMSCAACQAHVTNAVNKLDGVKEANVSLLTNSMEVEYDENIVDEGLICMAVKNAGYKAYTGKKEVKKDRSLLKLIIGFSFLLIIMYLGMGVSHFGFPIFKILDPSINPLNFAVAEGVLTLGPVIIFFNFFIKGFKLLFKLAPNMDSLIALSATASIIYGIFAIIMIANGNVHFVHMLYFESAAMILCLVSLGKYFESLSKKNTTKAIEELVELAPKMATILKEGGEKVVLAEEVEIGDIVIIKKGEVVAVDGKIIEGKASINEANITGESMPALKSVGDSVYSSTTLNSGFIKVEALKVGKSTMIEEIITLVSEAANSKAPISRLVDKISSIFVPVVIGISILTFIINFIIRKDFNETFNYAISVLVIACPCALGLATPVAIMVGSGKGAKLGLLIRNAEILEKMSKIEVIVFDKTGTITKGEPVVQEVIAFDKTIKPLEIAYSLEKLSEHPLSKAVCDYAKRRYSDFQIVEDYEAVEGKGIMGKIDGTLYKVGNLRWLDDSNEEVRKEVEKASSLGNIPLIIFKEDLPIGLILIKDELKPNAKLTIQKLKEQGIKCLMLTGDNRRVAGMVAEEVGVDEVIAEVLPQDKQRVIKELADSGKMVAMVGDGVNDALALTEASLSIAIGKGSDVAIDSSDIVILKNDLLDVYNAIRLSSLVLRKIKGNLFWAFFYNSIGIILATGAFSFLGIKLNPMIGSFAMSLSSLFVVTNALTINLFKPLKAEFNTNKVKYKVEGMMCDNCVRHVTEASLASAGVKSADVSLKKKEVELEITSEFDEKEFIEQVSKAGYKVIK